MKVHYRSRALFDLEEIFQWGQPQMLKNKAA
jgi:hypothetical protein